MRPYVFRRKRHRDAHFHSFLFFFIFSLYILHPSILVLDPHIFCYKCYVNLLLSAYILKHTTICSYTKFSLYTPLTSHLKSLTTHFHTNVNIMSSWHYGGSSSSNPIKDKPIIPDIMDEFTSIYFYEDNPDDQEIVPVPTMDYNPYGKVELRERMHFDSKEATVFAIKHYHITNGYNFNDLESKPHLYVARCIYYNNGYQWRLRTSYSKIKNHWKIKSIDSRHTCFSTLIS